MTPYLISCVLPHREFHSRLSNSSSCLVGQILFLRAAAGQELAMSAMTVGGTP